MNANARKQKQQVFDTIDDLVARFLYYDRKEDEELPVDAIEELIASGELSIDELVKDVSDALRIQLERGVRRVRNKVAPRDTGR